MKNTPHYLKDPNHPFGKISMEGMNLMSYDDIEIKPGVYYWAHGDNAEAYEVNKKVANSEWKYHNKEGYNEGSPSVRIECRWKIIGIR